MKGSMKYTFHFSFEQAGMLENTLQPFPTDWMVWGSCPPSPSLSQYKCEQGVNNINIKFQDYTVPKNCSNCRGVSWTNVDGIEDVDDVLDSF